jgi:alpha-N-arabinofuranosidase
MAVSFCILWTLREEGSVMGSKRSLAISVVVLAIVGVAVFNVVTGAQPKAASKLVVNADLGKLTINRNIYGHFSEHLGHCIYGGYWVGEDSSMPNTRGIRNDVVEALKKTKIPVLRWPGGCFADEYHWMDGIGPREQRPTMINTHWGGVTENNHFGTHEFLDLCAQLECEPCICGNVGSGTVEELSEWVEYVTFDGKSPMADLRRRNGRDEPWKVKYWGIGNENWGCGGNMEPEYYAQLYRRFQTYVRDYPGNEPYKIACGAYGDNYKWTEVLMENVEPRMMQGLSLHYYCGSGRESDSATRFTEVDWFHQLKNARRIDEYIVQHKAIMDRHDPENEVALIVDEWGAWHDREPGSTEGFLYQQNSLRDALVAGITLNILNSHCDRVKMANIAQTVNVLQAMVLTKDAETIYPTIVLTPTYHVFDLYKVHQDATYLPCELECEDYEFGNEDMPALNVSASRDESGAVHISLCNLNPNKTVDLVCDIRGAKVNRVSGRVLTAKKINSHNTFEKPETVKPAVFDDFERTDSGLKVTLPSKSVVVLEIR